MSEQQSDPSATVSAVTGRSARVTRDRIKALLAGGTILVAGAGVTLAAWTTGATVATPTLSAGEFGVELSVDAGGRWKAATGTGPNTAQTIRFTGASQTLKPGIDLYSTFLVRTTAGSWQANGVLSAAGVKEGSSTALLDGLSYELYDVTNASSCAAGGAELVPARLLLSKGAKATAADAAPAVAAGRQLVLAEAATTAPGAVSTVCLRLSMADSAYNNRPELMKTSGGFVYDLVANEVVN
ncbi:hypothetical protein ACL9RL_12950 [Plantibacter sp. Mn2098]|uniref:hypothetical protein n=1 Tax=Plantibacter sp. Mn2098 TaxID=3395266 RepID=UPI003BBE9C8E